MLAINKLTRMTIAVGLLTMVSLIFTVLALSDIYSGVETDLSTEWVVVRITFFLVPLFIALTMACIWRVNKRKT